MLATLPETSSSLDNANTTVVGVALWYHPTSSPTISTGSDKSSSSDRQDIDVINDEHFTTAMATAKTTFFDDVYGKTGHLHLQLLCTHPAFGRRGVGKAMVGWGISVARGDGTGVGMVEGRSMGVGEEEGKGKGVGVVSLMASQVGVGLYEGLGFKRLGWVRIGEGEEGEEMGEGLGLGLEAMVLDLREGGGGGAGEAGGGG